MPEAGAIHTINGATMATAPWIEQGRTPRSRKHEDPSLANGDRDEPQEAGRRGPFHNLRHT